MKKMMNIVFFGLTAFVSANSAFAACHGEVKACKEFPLNVCSKQAGCFLTPDGKACTGVAFACVLIPTKEACEKQESCAWVD